MTFLCYIDQMLSIIIPTFNELNNGIIQRTLKLLSEIEDIEVILVDSYSTDGTVELINSYPFKLIQTNTTSRAKRLNEGILAATHDMIILHHPRSILSSEGIEHLKSNKDIYTWGAFKHQFDKSHYLLKFTSWWSNFGRGSRGIFYLDHCIFAKKDILLQVGLIPEVDIFEDTEISIRLKQITKPTLLPYPSTTLAIRFTKNGIWKQALLNQKMKWQYYLKSDHKQMNKSYENGLNLNSNYNKDK